MLTATFTKELLGKNSSAVVTKASFVQSINQSIVVQFIIVGNVLNLFLYNSVTGYIHKMTCTLNLQIYKNL